MQELGSSLVVTADELQGALKGWPHGKPKLGLDCIGGKDSFEVAKVLECVVLCSDLYGDSLLVNTKGILTCMMSCV